MLFDGVVPCCEQFTAQHNRAAADCSVSAFISAALQQSISPIAPPMLHDGSLGCSGAPATALPVTTSNMTKDMRRVLITIDHCIENSQCLSTSSGWSQVWQVFADTRIPFEIIERNAQN